MTKGTKGKNLNSEFIFTYVVNIALRIRNFINLCSELNQRDQKLPKYNIFEKNNIENIQDT